MKKIISMLGVLSLIVFASPALANVEYVSGDWIFNAPNSIVFSCGGGEYAHTLNTVLQDENGDFSGTGTYDANNGYTWNITGNIDGNSIEYQLVYSGINSGYTLNGAGSIEPDGSIHGTTDGNCQSFSMPADSLSVFEGNHGQYVRSQENKRDAAQSRVGMPTQSKGHTK